LALSPLAQNTSDLTTDGSDHSRACARYENANRIAGSGNVDEQLKVDFAASNKN